MWFLQQRPTEIHNGEPTIRLFGGGFREAVKQSLQGEVILSSIITRSLAQHDDCIPEISLFYTTKKHRTTYMRKATQSVNYLAAACNYIILHTHIVIWLFVLIMWILRLSKRNDPFFPLKLLAAHFNVSSISWRQKWLRRVPCLTHKTCSTFLVSWLPISFIKATFFTYKLWIIVLNTIFFPEQVQICTYVLTTFFDQIKRVQMGMNNR